MAGYSSASSKESLEDYQQMREQLKRENEELKKKLVLFGIIPDSTFLPLKPDSENDLTSSKQAIIAPTLTDADSTLSSYLPLPAKHPGKQNRDTTRGAQGISVNDSILPAKEQVERVMMKADMLLERTLPPAIQGNSRGDTPKKSLSDYTLGSDGFSVSPQRPSKANRHVRIGSRQYDVKEDSSDSTLTEVETQPKTVIKTAPTISKKLDFYNSSEEELSEIEQNSKNKYQDDVDKNWGKRVIGEIAFQLDRRILQYIFSHRRRLYGFTVRNISGKIQEISFDDYTNAHDSAKIMELQRKRDIVMNTLLEHAHYDPIYHAIFSELVVNKYGILKVNPCEAKEQLKALRDFNVLKTIISDNVDPQYRKDTNVLLKALNAMSLLDRKPILSW